jgi:predicted DNA-binding transcriptional regulator AlpA
MPDHELVLEPECHELTRLHCSTRWRLERKGKFPRSFKIGDPDAPNGRKAWSRSEIMNWIADRMAARSKHPITRKSAGMGDGMIRRGFSQ